MAVGVPGAQHDCRERDARHRDGLVALLQDRVGEQAALPRDLRVGELRPQTQAHLGLVQRLRDLAAFRQRLRAKGKEAE